MEAEVEPDAENGISMILGHTRLERRATLGITEIHGFIEGTADVDAQAYMQALLTAHYLPMYDDNADTVPTEAVVAGIFRKRIPGVLAVHDETDPDETVTIDANLLGTGDVTTESAGIYWRPDVPSVGFLVNKGEPMVYHKQMMRLGWGFGNAYRPGPANKFRYQTGINATIKKGIKAGAAPGILIWVLTIPPENSLDATIDQTRPQANEFAHLDFLSPPKSPIGIKDDALQMSTLADWRHWAVQ